MGLSGLGRPIPGRENRRGKGPDAKSKKRVSLARRERLKCKIIGHQVREKRQSGMGTLEANTGLCKDVGFHSRGERLPVACTGRSSITRLTRVRLDCKNQGYKKIRCKKYRQEILLAW